MSTSRLVTIKDVAKEAGVSIGAVSKVLHGRGGNIRVSEATAQRIRDAARTLNYRPNYHARSLRSGRSRSVGLVAGAQIRAEERGLYNVYLLDRVMAILHARGYTLNFAPELMPLADLQGLTDGRFDGLIWIDGAPTGPLVEAFYESPVPVVAIGGIYEEVPKRGALFLHDEEGGHRMMLDHLAELGHRSLLYSQWADSPYSPVLEMRRIDFVDAARARGFRVATDVATDEAEAIERWRASEDRPAAIVTPNDRWGAMLMIAADRAGVKISDELSIAAFDGSPITLWGWPGLSTVRPSVDPLVGRATDHLIRQMEREPAEPVLERFESTLHPAGSTGPAPKG